MQNTQLILENAAKGLLMMSESDYPFTYFTNPAREINADLILSLAGKTAGTLIEETDIDRLLSNLTNTASGSVNQETAHKFSNLSNQLKQELKQLKVYRVGEIQIEVLIIGLTKEGTVAGMHTKLIET